MRGPLFAVVAFALLGCDAAPAGAHVVSDREVRVLHDLSPGLIQSAASGDRPDSNGLVGPNRDSWLDVYHQHGALLLLMDSAARSDSVGAEAAWKAIDAAFVHQTPTGEFEAARGASKADSSVRLSGAAVWLAELCRTEVALMNGPLQNRFRWRVTLLLPKLRRSIDHLASRGDALARLHRERPDLLLVDAQAFLLADGIYHEVTLGLLGQRFLMAALALQQSSGAFSVRGDPSLGSQSRALSSLIEITLYFPAPSLEKAAVRGAQWIERRLGGRLDPPVAHGVGDASSPSPRAALRDALIALSYQAAASGDERSRNATSKTVARWLPRVGSLK